MRVVNYGEKNEQTTVAEPEPNKRNLISCEIVDGNRIRSTYSTIRVISIEKQQQRTTTTKRVLISNIAVWPHPLTECTL